MYPWARLFMAVGTGGAGGAIAPPPPPIFCQPKKFKSLKITTYKSVYSNKDKIGFFLPPQSQIRSYGLAVTGTLLEKT